MLGHMLGRTEVVMGREINRLNARAVATITKHGRHADGGGLYLFELANGGRRCRAHPQRNRADLRLRRPVRTYKDRCGSRAMRRNGLRARQPCRRRTMSPSGSRIQISGTSATGSCFCRRASRSNADGRNTDGAFGSLFSRIGGKDKLVLAIELSVRDNHFIADELRHASCQRLHYCGAIARSDPGSS